MGTSVTPGHDATPGRTPVRRVRPGRMRSELLVNHAGQLSAMQRRRRITRSPAQAAAGSGPLPSRACVAGGYVARVDDRGEASVEPGPEALRQQVVGGAHPVSAVADCQGLLYGTCCVPSVLARRMPATAAADLNRS